MQKMISQIRNPEIPLKKRLFQLLSVIALAEFLIVTIYTILSGGDLVHILVMLIGTVLFTVTVTFTVKSGRMRLGATISGLLYFSIYPTTYFSSGGMYGGAPVVFSFALVYVFLVTERWSGSSHLRYALQRARSAMSRLTGTRNYWTVTRQLLST